MLNVLIYHLKMSSRRVAPGTFKFVLVGIVFMLLADFFILPHTNFSKEPKTQPMNSISYVDDSAREIDIITSLNMTSSGLMTDIDYNRHFPSGPVDESLSVTSPESVPVIAAVKTPLYEAVNIPKALPADFQWNSHYSGPPVIAIVIDDLGVNKKLSRAVVNIKGPFTLAFLPYASGVKEMAAGAKANGHELIIHMPMEPMNPDLDVGAIALTTGQSAPDFENALDEAYQSFSGYSGMNNHMGSRLTQDEAAMKRLMASLKARDLYFLDSRTIHTSVAAEHAFRAGVPYAIRDVFLDHDPSYDSVMASLLKAEKLAMETGQAIAIGHPKDHTIAALKDWMETLADKNIQLVSVRDLLVRSHVERAVSHQQDVIIIPASSIDQSRVMPRQ